MKTSDKNKNVHSQLKLRNSKKKKAKKRQWDGFVRKNTKSPDPVVWKELPCEVQLNLLDHLPLPAMYRFAAVSKSWHAASRGVKEVTIRGKCYVTNLKKDGNLSIYSMVDKAWLHIPIPCDDDAYILSSHDGTVWFSDLCDRKLVSWIARWNPLSGGQFIHLTNVPAMSQYQTLFAGMEVLQDSSYIIVFVKDEKNETVVRVYDSKTGQWGRTKLQLRRREQRFMYGIEESFSKCAALRGSTLFFLSISTATPCSITLYSVNVFDTTGYCSKLSTLDIVVDWTPIIQSTFHPKLVVWSGKVLLAYIQAVKPFEGDRETIALKAFDERKKTWELVSCLPLEMLPGKRKNVGFSADEDGITIAHVSVSRDEVCVVVPGFYAYAYDLRVGTWAVIPEHRTICPFELGKTENCI